eukprot:XP_022265840.1 basic proline-rich protein-like [Canis lupus familiaris]
MPGKGRATEGTRRGKRQHPRPEKLGDLGLPRRRRLRLRLLLLRLRCSQPPPLSADPDWKDSGDKPHPVLAAAPRNEPPLPRPTPLRARDGPTPGPWPPTLTRAWAPGPLEPLPATLPEERRGLDVLGALPVQCVTPPGRAAPGQGPQRGTAGGRGSARRGFPRALRGWEHLHRRLSPWGIVPPPPVTAVGGDDVLHFVGTAVGTWDQFKTKARGAGKLGPAKPQLGSAIRPRAQPLIPACASEGPLGRAPQGTHPDAAPRLHPPRWRKLRAPRERGSRLSEGPRPPLGVSSRAAVVLLRSLVRWPSPASTQPPHGLHRLLVLNRGWRLHSAVGPIASPRRGCPGAGSRAEVRGVAPGPDAGVPGAPHPPWGSSLFTVYTYVFGARHGAVRSPRSQPRGQGGLFRLTLAVAGGTAAAGGGQMGDERAQAGEAADKGSGRSSSGSLTSGLTPGHWNQDLSRRQTLNQLRFSAPGNHHSTVYLYDFDICKDATDYRACYQSMR